MNIYRAMYHAPKPEGIEGRKAYIVGGGIAGLATAAFLVDDASMPGTNITIFEKLPEVGGSMDGRRNNHGYRCRGERELEPYMECLWYLCAKVPSLENCGRTVLDDVVDFNKDEPIHSECRVLVDRGHIYARIHDFSTSPETRAKLVQLVLEPEEELEDQSIEDYFAKDSDFFAGTTWLISHTMLAFKPYHSVLEFQRYLLRFALATRLEYLEGIIHTKYNEFDAIIKPILVWLGGQGVNIVTDCTVTDIQLDAACNTVTGLELRRGDEPISTPVSDDDLVFVTNGSMTQNAEYGDNTTVAATDRSTADRGVFTLWEELAAKDPKFGSPEKFISDIDRTKWMSFFPTIKGYPQFVERLEKLTGSKAGTGGGITIKDSSWGLGIILHHKPFFPDQADDEDVFWGYGLFGENEGDHVKKPMCECTGREILTELLYHLDLLDVKDELLAHTSVSTAMMPYITSQFMPHKISDRPRIVPAGCTNLAFIGQYVEVPGEAVFTVEMSVRTGLEGVYRLTHLDKEILEVYPSRYDIRYRLEQIKKDLGIVGPIRAADLPKVRLSTLVHWRKHRDELLELINSIPPYDVMYLGRDRRVASQHSVLHPEYPPEAVTDDLALASPDERGSRARAAPSPRSGAGARPAPKRPRRSGNVTVEESDVS